MPDTTTGATTGAADHALAALRAQILVVRPELDPAQVLPGTTLEQLGCSSMDRAEITVLTMEELRVTLSPRELADVHDVSGLLDALAAKL